MLLICLLSIVVSLVTGSCPDTSGEAVPWWILYQQKSIPFIHFYVNSRDMNNIKVHYPEKPDSVLARAIAKITDGQLEQYFVYINDFLNIQSLSRDLGYPSSLKWTNGIFAVDKSWKRGYWLLHNNIHFPITRDKVLVGAEDKLWYPSTVGDSSDSVFYVCLSMENNRDLIGILNSILAGNPIIYQKNIDENMSHIPFFQGTGATQSTFVLEGSAVIFMNCLYSSNNDSLDKCIFKYSVHGSKSISVITRSRGMLRRGKGICYDKNVIHLFDFVSLTDAEYSTVDYNSLNTMFALSDDSSGTTCFGQDIAAYTDTVAVMVCVDLPALKIGFLKSFSVSHWACPSSVTSSIGNDKRKNIHADFNPRKQEGKDALSPDRQSKEIITKRNKRQIQSISRGNGLLNTKIANKTEESSDETITKGINSKEPIDTVATPVWKNPLVKNEKLYLRYTVMIREMNEILVLPSKTKEKTWKAQKTLKATTVNTENEVALYLLKNRKHVLALFCQESCRYCNPVEEIFNGIRTELLSSEIDIVVVDADVVSDSHLSVQYTPFVSSSKPPDTHLSMVQIEVPIRQQKRKRRSASHSHKSKLIEKHGQLRERNEKEKYIRSKRGVADSFLNKHLPRIPKDFHFNVTNMARFRFQKPLNTIIYTKNYHQQMSDNLEKYIRQNLDMCKEIDKGSYYIVCNGVQFHDLKNGIMDKDKNEILLVNIGRTCKYSHLGEFNIGVNLLQKRKRHGSCSARNQVHNVQKRHFEIVHLDSTRLTERNDCPYR